MGVEVRPLGVQCNIQCQYCYQNPQRDAGHFARSYDLAAIKAAIRSEGGPFALFGGEPLLLPKRDLEDLLSWGFLEYGRNSIQTNGTLIDDEHVVIFKKYNVNVGISIDGPGVLNDVRWHGNLQRTREATGKTEAAIERLCDAGIPPSLIVTLHRGNASTDNLPVLCEWISRLERKGVRSVRLHLLESESDAIREKYALSTDENIRVLLTFQVLQKRLESLTFDLFVDMRRMLLGEDNSTTCIWNACDPYTTHAVRGVEGHGERSNCGRTNKDGIDFVKSSVPGYERYLALYQTPQESNGCRGCRFFLMCKGQCPGTAVDGDWRNRTEHCEVWKTVYGKLEEELLGEGKVPVSARADRTEIERFLLAGWAKGEMTFMSSLTRRQSVPPSKESHFWKRELAAVKRELQEILGDGCR